MVVETAEGTSSTFGDALGVLIETKGDQAKAFHSLQERAKCSLSAVETTLVTEIAHGCGVIFEDALCALSRANGNKDEALQILRQCKHHTLNLHEHAVATSLSRTTQVGFDDAVVGLKRAGGNREMALAIIDDAKVTQLRSKMPKPPQQPEGSLFSAETLEWSKAMGQYYESVPQRSFFMPTLFSEFDSASLEGASQAPPCDIGAMVRKAGYINFDSATGVTTNLATGATWCSWA